ncbi:MAG: FAD:protein FMN transferase [Clostridiales bacterium]|nr:FAD:protein FMN transferase [Clostridiales bacterium]
MKKIVVFILLVISIVLFVACSSMTTNTFNSFDYFSTVITLNTYTNKEVNVTDAWQEMKLSLGIMEDKLSVYVDDSDISNFNGVSEGSTIEISKITYDVLTIAKEAYEKTNGLYNPAMYLLSDLWGFTDRFTTSSYTPQKPYDRQNPREELPDTKYIDGFLTLIDYSKVELSKVEDKFYVTKPSDYIEIDGFKYTMQLDLGGIVKGYAAAILKKTAQNFNIEYGYVTLGSSSLALFERNEKGQKWDLKLKDPLNSDSYYLQTEQSSIYVSTSGNYEQYYEIAGKRYCHIINPITGCPIDNGNLSATIITNVGNDDIKASSLIDAYSTALMVMNIDSAKQFVQENDFKAYIALKDGDKHKVYTNDDSAKILANYERI